MNHQLPTYFYFVLSALASLAISMYAVRKVMLITTRRRIFDTPDNTRKMHGTGIPSMGGGGIFAGYLVVSSYCMLFAPSGTEYLIASSAILFFTGMYDDIMDMRPMKKLLAQLLAAGISMYFLCLRPDFIDAIERIFPFASFLPWWVVYSGATIACTFYINAFNFTDGIDGLACTQAIFTTAVLGILFIHLGHPGISGILFSLCGATAGLLWYNKSPAKIYMGDTGSMLLGFNIFYFSCSLMGEGSTGSLLNNFGITTLWPIAVTLLFLPAFDAVRVFAIRLSKGKSPFSADRTHLHYYLLDAGCTHNQAVSAITGTQLLQLILCIALINYPAAIILSNLATTAALIGITNYTVSQKGKK